MISLSGPAVFFSWRASRIANLSVFLDVDIAWRPLWVALEGRGSIVVWGKRAQARYARKVSDRLGMPLYTIEDGFVRSVGRNNNLLSLVVDDLGIYFDAAHPSRFEAFVLQELSPSEELRSWTLVKLWRSSRISKYNDALELKVIFPGSYVLVCDQTFGDASISYGLASSDSFPLMLQAALTENPNHTIVLKTHPDVITRGKKGHFDLRSLASNERIQIISDPIHPSKLIEHADAVYTVTSQMGFEALIWGKPVRCFGMPFYAGWGLTEDELPAPESRKPITLEQLVHAALVEYPRYIDPVTLSALSLR